MVVRERESKKLEERELLWLPLYGGGETGRERDIDQRRRCWQVISNVFFTRQPPVPLAGRIELPFCPSLNARALTFYLFIWYKTDAPSHRVKNRVEISWFQVQMTGPERKPNSIPIDGWMAVMGPRGMAFASQEIWWSWLMWLATWWCTSLQV